MIPKSWGLERGLELVKKAGFDGVELWLGGSPWLQVGTSDADVIDLARRVKDAGLVVSNVSNTLDWDHPISSRDPAIRQLAIEELEKIGIINKEDVADAVVVKEPLAYPGYFGSYGRFDEVKAYLNSIPNLYPIGRNGMHKYNNQDHSMLTAMEAVDLFLSGQTDKSSLWDINTEEEYHEQK